MSGLRKRVLLVDDEHSFTRLMRLNLEKTGGYEVREENSGARALEAAREFHPDIVLLDVIMPDMDGGSVASQIQAAEDLQGTRIVFLTAVLSKHEVPAGGSRLNFIPCLAKPVSAKEIIACIEGHTRK